MFKVKTIRRIVGTALVALPLIAASPPSPAVAQTLMNGAGATFPYPIYSKWFDEYIKVDPSVRFNYQSIGSGGGIRQITERTVDFGATDAPMTPEEMAKAPAPLLHLPMTLGAVVVTYSLPELTSPLQLSPEAVAGIFLGDIKSW